MSKPHRWPNFTGDQTSPVTKCHRSPNRHRWPDFTDELAHRRQSCTRLPTRVKGIEPPTNPHKFKSYFNKFVQKLCNFRPQTLKLSPIVDESNSAGEVEDAGSPPRQLTPPREVDRRPHRGTELFPAVAYHASPVPETVPTTEAAEDLSDGGDGVELSSPTLARSFSATVTFFESAMFIHKWINSPLVLEVDMLLHKWISSPWSSYVSWWVELKRCVLLHVVKGDWWKQVGDCLLGLYISAESVRP